jgi:hypothetical protein
VVIFVPLFCPTRAMPNSSFQADPPRQAASVVSPSGGPLNS